MYNGIGLATPRGSGTNGHVQRNWALVKPRIKDKTYKTEQELAILDTASTRQPNKEILDHERKRKIELKCAEFSDILEEQGFSEEVIINKVNNYRSMLMGQGGKLDKPIDQWGRPCVTETHQVAEAQQEKNARLREAFGISEYFVDGSSFDPNRQAKEKLAKSVALQEKEKESSNELEKENEKIQAIQYQLVHTPSPEPPELSSKENNTKKKKRKRRNSSSSEESKKKKKKNRKKDSSSKLKEKKKRKKQKKAYLSEESPSSENEFSSEDERKKRLKRKEKKKVSRKRKSSSSQSSRESSPEPSKKIKLDERYKSKKDKNSKTERSKYKLDHLKTKSLPRSTDKYVRENKSKSPYSKRDRISKNRSLRSNSRESSHKESFKSVGHRERKKSKLKREKSRSPSLERRYSKNKTPDANYDKKIELQCKDRHKFSKSKAGFLESRKSRSRSLDSRNNYSRKSVSRERSKSTKRSRSQSANRKLDKYNNNQNKKRKEFRRYSRSPDIYTKRSKSPVSPVYERRRRKSPKIERLQKCKSKSPTTGKLESTSPSSNRVQNSNKSLTKDYKYEKFSKKYVKNSEQYSKSSKGSIHRRCTISDEENFSGSEKLQDTLKLSKKDFCATSIGCSTKESKNREEKDKESRKISVDKRAERYSNNSREERRSLTPDIKSRSVYNPTDQGLSRSNTPDIKKRKQKETFAKHSKSKKPLPVVRLRTSSNERETSDNEHEKEEEEDDREVKILRLLKTDLAAKAKESLERKKEKVASPRNMTRHIEPDVFDIKVLPLKIEKDKSQISINKDEFTIERNISHDRSRTRLTNAYLNSKISKSRSRSFSHSSVSSKESDRSKSSDSCSTHSPSHSRTVSRSRSRSSSSSSSSDSSSTRHSRSPSIPRRHGSPSFLDRRRITRHQ